MRERCPIEKDLAPHIGGLPVADIAAPAPLAALRKIEAHDAVETAQLKSEFFCRCNAGETAVRTTDNTTPVTRRCQYPRRFSDEPRPG